MAKRVAVLMLTPACNMKCAFCGADEGFRPMLYEQAMSLLGSLQDEGVDSVVLGGGEPFLWPYDLLGLARRAAQFGLLVQVGSNGLEVRRDHETLEAFHRWVLPLEAYRQDLNDTMRPAEKSHFLSVTNLMDALRQGAKEVTISTLVSSKNHEALEELGDFLRAYVAQGGRLHAWHLYRFLPVGRGGESHVSEFKTSESLYSESAEKLKADFADLQIYLRPDMSHSKRVSFHWNQNGALQRSGARLIGNA